MDDLNKSENDVASFLLANGVSGDQPNAPSSYLGGDKEQSYAALLRSGMPFSDASESTVPQIEGLEAEQEAASSSLVPRSDQNKLEFRMSAISKNDPEQGSDNLN